MTKPNERLRGRLGGFSKGDWVSEDNDLVGCWRECSQEDHQGWDEPITRPIHNFQEGGQDG